MKKTLLGTICVITGVSIGMAIYQKAGKNKEKIQEKNYHVPYGPYEKFIKRLLDVLLSGIAIIALSPVMAVTAILVKIKLGSPILFRQERLGKDETPFFILKYRSMTDARNSDGVLLPDKDRLTSVGRFLRSTSIDELPELINILRGDMSIVGPRPLLIRYLSAYTEEERHRHDVRPGLTGLAQINGRNFVEWDRRLAYDVEYINRVTFVGDVKIMIKTVAKVFERDDIAVNTDEIDEGYLDEIRAGRIIK